MNLSVHIYSFRGPSAFRVVLFVFLCHLRTVTQSGNVDSATWQVYPLKTPSTAQKFKPRAQLDPSRNRRYPLCNIVQITARKSQSSTRNPRVLGYGAPFVPRFRRCRGGVNGPARVPVPPRAEPGRGCTAYPSFAVGGRCLLLLLPLGRWGVNTHYLWTTSLSSRKEKVI